jgi:integrase
MSKTLYMVFRKNRWLYSRRVPTELIPVLGYQVIRRSLSTADKAVAMKRRSALDATVEAMFDEARKTLDSQVGLGSLKGPKIKSLSRSEARNAPIEIITQHVRQMVAADVARASKSYLLDPPENAEEHAEMLQGIDETASILRNRNDQRGLEWISKWTDRILAVTGLIDNPKVDQAMAAEIVKRGLLEVELQKLDLARGNYSATHYDPLFDPKRQDQTDFGSLCEMYLADKAVEFDKNSVSQKRRDKVATETKALREIIGDHVLVQAIDDDVFQTVRRVLAEMPSQRTKLFGHLSLDAAIKKRASSGADGLAHLTQKRYLGTLKNILAFAMRKRMISYNPADAATPLVRDDVADHERRVPWDDDQIVKFFTGTFYQSCSPNAVAPYANTDRDWRFWLPLLLLFTGARPNEIAQLYYEDLKRTEKGTWHLVISPSPENSKFKKSLKTKASIRRIPLHPEILKIGFLDFVERVKSTATDNPRLFPDLKPDHYGNNATYALKKFREVFVPQEIELRERQTFYSLRHNFREQLRHINAPADTLRAIAGWSPAGKAASYNYGDPLNPDHHIGWVSKVSYDGLDLSFLHVKGS